MLTIDILDGIYGRTLGFHVEFDPHYLRSKVVDRSGVYLVTVMEAGRLR